ncbi:MAG: sulfite exporter TauE/SafE family protein [Nitrospinae bacterium]|nr:sulfite exporter TauE/SafE family protein [Nitrospinota bacterium]MBF0633490.1 sulfite exporter TauE/SafE family protein [Nitrospinota bacterium]
MKRPIIAFLLSPSERPRVTLLILILASLFTILAQTPAFAADIASMQDGEGTPWWIWPLILFVVTYLIGIIAVLGGVGGAVLFVPIVSGFFPFHLDFVRGAGLLVALSASLAASPGLMRKGLADFRLALPLGLIASTSAIAGAMIGLALPAQIVQTAMGMTILAIVAIMFLARKSDYPQVREPDALSTALGIHGVYFEETLGRNVEWKIHRTAKGMGLFVLIGFMAGMFGLGAGWANVPTLNLLMGAPLKLSVATSMFLLSITDTTAAWVYINQGAILPMLVAPSLIGIMLGSMTGVRMLTRAKPAAIRKIVMIMLFLAGMRAMLKGLGI